jgi:hypothetical protein
VVGEGPSELDHIEAHGLTRSDHALVVRCDRDVFAAFPEERHRSEVERIERPDRHGKRTDRALEDKRLEFDPGEPAQEEARRVPMRASQVGRMK